MSTAEKYPQRTSISEFGKEYKCMIVFALSRYCRINSEYFFSRYFSMPNSSASSKISLDESSPLK